MAFDTNVLHITMSSLMKWPLSVYLVLFYIIAIARGCCEFTVCTPLTQVHVCLCSLCTVHLYVHSLVASIMQCSIEVQLMISLLTGVMWCEEIKYPVIKSSSLVPISRLGEKETGAFCHMRDVKGRHDFNHMGVVYVGRPRMFNHKRFQDYHGLFLGQIWL